jgi:hypothetical protein
MSNLTAISPSGSVNYTPTLNNSPILNTSSKFGLGEVYQISAGTGLSPQQQDLQNYSLDFILKLQGKTITRIRDIAVDQIATNNITALCVDGVILTGSAIATFSESYNRLKYDQIQIAFAQSILGGNSKYDFSAGGFRVVAVILSNSGRVNSVIKSDGGFLWQGPAVRETKNNPPPKQEFKSATVVAAPTVVATPATSTKTKPEVAAQPATDTTPTSELEVAKTEAVTQEKPGAPDTVKSQVPDIPEIKFAESFNPDSNFYRIIYKDSNNNPKAFVFTFLPARETKIGNWNVPEAKAGLPIQTKMRHKMQVIPGAGPLVQTVGINGTTLTLVGALLGNEVIAEDFSGPGLSSIQPIYPNTEYAGKLPRGAYDKTQELTQRLVYPGKPVTVEVKPSSNQATFQMASNTIGDFIRFTGVVTAVRIHYAHSDRAYYALDLFVTEYPNAPAATPNRIVSDSKDKDAAIKAAKASKEDVYAFFDGLPEAQRKQVAAAVDKLNLDQRAELIDKLSNADPKNRLEVFEQYIKKPTTTTYSVLDTKLTKAERAQMLKVATSPDNKAYPLAFTFTRALPSGYSTVLLASYNALNQKQKADIDSQLKVSKPEDRYDIFVGYIRTLSNPTKAKPKKLSAIQTATPIDEGYAFDRELISKYEGEVSETSVLAADYISNSQLTTAPIGAVVRQNEAQSILNIESAARDNNVMAAINHIGNSQLRPPQRIKALENILASSAISPSQADNLNIVLNRYKI